MRVADGPFSEVRARKPNDKPDRGDTGDCGCGMPFNCIAIQHDGKKRFFWCTRCDIAGRKR